MSRYRREIHSALLEGKIKIVAKLRYNTGPVIYILRIESQKCLLRYQYQKVLIHVKQVG